MSSSDEGSFSGTESDDSSLADVGLDARLPWQFEPLAQVPVNTQAQPALPSSTNLRIRTNDTSW